MRIKIGNVWHEQEDGAICVQFTPKDQANIANMSPDASMYACFPSGCRMTADQKIDWMGGKDSYEK